MTAIELGQPVGSGAAEAGTRRKSWTSIDLRRLAEAVLVMLAFFGSLSAAGRLTSSDDHAIAYWGTLALAGLLVLLAIGSLVVHWMISWRHQLSCLRGLIEDVQAGRIPIEALRKVDGPMRELAGQVRQILHEQRQLKSQLLQAELDLRQRIAQRTDALERTIGSLRQQAIRDSLTGLFNRRMYDQHLAEIVRRSKDAGSDLALLMLDLDNFKLLNDTMGHAVGDEFLRSAGQIIRSTIRGQDMAFRCGGDEFVVVMPGASLQGGEALAQRLVNLIDSLGKTYKLPQSPGISAGVTHLLETRTMAGEELTQLADQRLYAHKHQRKSATSDGLPRPASRGADGVPKANPTPVL